MYFLNNDENAFKDMTDEQLEDLILDKKAGVKYFLNYFENETKGISKNSSQYLELKGKTLLVVFALYAGVANTLKAMNINFYSDRAIENRKLMLNTREKLDETIKFIDDNKINVIDNQVYEYDEKTISIKIKDETQKVKRPMGFF